LYYPLSEIAGIETEIKSYLSTTKIIYSYAISRIIPDYRGGSTSPYFAASIPFVASSVILRTNGEPFIVAYEVSADIVQPKIIRHLENVTLTAGAASNNTSAVR
jgi:hypothetical protein